MSLSACGPSSRHEDRLFSALERANARAAEDQARIAMLEERLARMEQSAEASRARASASTDRRLEAQIDRLIDLNQRVLLSQHAAHAGEPAPARPDSLSPSDDPSDPRAELRRLVERMYGGSSGFRGGLSVEQSEALKVLLRPERPLDTHNPWY